MRRLITCPETAHLEEIEYYEDPVDGTILGATRCTRFTPDTDLSCDAECIWRLKRRQTLPARTPDEMRGPVIDEQTQGQTNNIDEQGQTN